MKDNLSTILGKLYTPVDFKPMQQRRQGRRLISPGLGGKPRTFAKVVRGRDLFEAKSLGDHSAIDLGKDLPSPEEMVFRDEIEKLQKNFLGGDDFKNRLLGAAIPGHHFFS